MNAHQRRVMRRTLLCLALSAGVTGCAGGGGGGSSPSAAAAVPVTSTTCTAPVVSDCALSAKTFTGGIQSDFKLFAMQVFLNTAPNTPTDYRFSGGTEVGAGGLSIAPLATLISSVVVNERGLLGNSGRIRGNVINAGQMQLGGVVQGDVRNDGTVYNDPSGLQTGRVEGNYTQTSTGRQYQTLPLAGTTPSPNPTLWVTGTAALAGTLELAPVSGAWDFEPVAPGPYTLWLLHANGGLTGSFDAWRATSILVTGSPRYTSTDAYFDVTSVSFATAMQNAPTPVSSQAQVGAARLDEVIARQALRPDGQDAVSPQLLMTARLLQGISDYGRAARALEGLAGGDLAREAHGHALNAPGPDLQAWLDQARPNLQDVYRVDAGNPALAAGGRFGTRWVWGFQQRALDQRMDIASRGITNRGEAAQMLVRRLGASGRYLEFEIGTAREDRTVSRILDLDLAGRYAATSHRRLNTSAVGFEMGRVLPLMDGQWIYSARIEWSATRSDAFNESGGSGFEIRSDAYQIQRAAVAAGVRYRHAFRFGNQPLRMFMGAGYRLPLAIGNAPWQASFAGMPSYRFSLAIPREQAGAWWQFGVAGGKPEATHWQLFYDRPARNLFDANSWSFQVAHPL